MDRRTAVRMFEGKVNNENLPNHVGTRRRVSRGPFGNKVTAVTSVSKTNKNIEEPTNTND